MRALESTLTRRRLLQGTGILLSGLLSRLALARDVDRQVLDAAASKARKFLVNQIDPDLQLLPEFPGSKVYWLYHDNYLAAKVLERTDPEKSKRILEAIRGFGIEGSGKIEILFNESKAPLPFRHHLLVEVQRIGPKIIKTEILRKEGHKDWAEYTDLLFMASIAEVKRDRDVAAKYFEAGLKTWDGVGFRDRVNPKIPRYATFKIALALIAASKLGEQPAARGKMVERLLSMQRDDGGFVTDYDSRGERKGEANVETTSLAVVALDSQR